jgi:hypothetical protein
MGEPLVRVCECVLAATVASDARSCGARVAWQGCCSWRRDRHAPESLNLSPGVGIVVSAGESFTIESAEKAFVLTMEVEWLEATLAGISRPAPIEGQREEWHRSAAFWLALLIGYGLGAGGTLGGLRQVDAHAGRILWAFKLALPVMVVAALVGDLQAGTPQGHTQSLRRPRSALGSARRPRLPGF